MPNGHVSQPQTLTSDPSVREAASSCTLRSSNRIAFKYLAMKRDNSLGSSTPAQLRAECKPRDDTRRRASTAALSSTQSSQGLPACLPALQARKLLARHGGGGSLGKRGARVNTISPGIIIYGRRRRVRYGQRLPDGWRSDSCLLVW